MFAWATPEYLFDHMSLEEVFFYYQEGLKFEEYRAGLIIHKLGEALDDKPKQQASPPQQSDRPDKAKFYKHYGDKIKRPSPEGGE